MDTGKQRSRLSVCHCTKGNPAQKLKDVDSPPRRSASRQSNLLLHIFDCALLPGVLMIAPNKPAACLVPSLPRPETLPCMAIHSTTKSPPRELPSSQGTFHDTLLFGIEHVRSGSCTQRNSFLVAQCSATPATVAATPPCSATPFQTQILVRHLPAQGGGEVRHQNF